MIDEVGLLEEESFLINSGLLDFKKRFNSRFIKLKNGIFDKKLFGILRISDEEVILPKKGIQEDIFTKEEALKLKGIYDYVAYVEDEEIKCIDLDDNTPHPFARKITIERLRGKNYFDASDEEIFIELLKRNLIEGFESKIDEKFIEDLILEVDKKRVDLTKYDRNLIYDINRGSWDLFRRKEFSKKIKLDKKLVDRDPKEDIKDGIIAIDFGTKSTVVVCHYNNETYPLRVGIGDLKKKVEKHHFENPTILEFIDFDKFLKDYNLLEYRPYTKWEDLRVSHKAFEDLKNSKSEFVNAFVKDLKQWVSSNRKIKIEDKQKKIFEIGEYQNTKLDLIEIYAYMLGNYINNQYNGVFLEYVLSFPVSFNKALKKRVLNSFKNGLKKSLPFKSDEIVVREGTSEPAAYSIVALKHYGFSEKEFSFYGVFDFGGGTTDFDFGIFRWADENNKKERRYDYVLEHFGAGGDRYLGGENLLELLAYEIFKDNIEIFRNNNFSFYRPFEGDRFIGDEVIVNDSKEAKLNLYKVVEAIRGFWERDNYEEEFFNEGEIKVNLVNDDFIETPGVSLIVDEEKLLNILKNRIKRGVDTFFESLRESIRNYSNYYDLSKVKEINIFLAGNSSKSKLVKDAFEEKIAQIKEEVSNGDILLFEPIDNSNDYLKPNGKTGVAFGLIESRKGSKVLVINKNIKDDETKFRYYVGYEKRGKFKVILSPESEYNKWVEFIDASEDIFEIFYTTDARASTNELNIDDKSIKKKRLKIDKIDEDGMIYIRPISIDEIEYGVDSFNFENKKKVRLD